MSIEVLNERFDVQTSSSALNSSPCACIVTSSGQEHKHNIARIVNCIFLEIMVLTSSPRLSSALKMAICSSAGQFEMYRCRRSNSDSNNWWNGVL